MEVSLIVRDAYIQVDEVAGTLFHIGMEYEEHFSRFLETSELSRVNKKGVGTMSNRFLEVFDTAMRVYEATDGACNPCVQVAQHGYNVSFGSISKEQPRTVTNTSYPTDFMKIKINRETQSISLPKGQKLDFASFLKGYVAHALADEAMSRGCSGVIVNLGGDTYTRGRDCDDALFSFSIYDPISHTDISIGTILDGALATSGTYKRRWNVRHGGIRTHLLMPNGEALADTALCSVSVHHKDGALADAYATAAFTLGQKQAEAFLLLHNIPHLFITNDGVVHGTLPNQTQTL